MEATEYIELNGSELSFLDNIERVITELSSLRADKEKTITYYENYLSADARHNEYQNHLIDYSMGEVDKKPIYEEADGEINYRISNNFRNELFKVIEHDDSFGYLFWLLATEKNNTDIYYTTNSIPCIANEHLIKAILHIEEKEIEEATKEIRNIKWKDWTSNWNTEEIGRIVGKRNDRTLKDIVIEEIRKQYQIDKSKDNVETFLNLLQNAYVDHNSIATEANQQTSKYRISEDRKTDFIKIISAMYECRIFKTTDEKIASNKKDLIRALTSFFNSEISDYSPLLSAAKTTGNYWLMRKSPWMKIPPMSTQNIMQQQYRFNQKD